MQSLGYNNAQKKPADSWREFYYFSYIVFKESSDQINAARFLNWSCSSENELQYSNQERDKGFEFKKEDNIGKAKEAFSKAVDSDDPISQYELAQLLGKQNQVYKDLLEKASPKLFQARVVLYRYYLENQDYEKANGHLILLLDLLRKLEAWHNDRLQVDFLPKVPRHFTIYPNEASYRHIKDTDSEKWVKQKIPSLHETLYENALLANEQERTYLLNLAAINGNLNAVLDLHKLTGQDREKFEKEKSIIEQLIIDSKKGVDLATKKLIELSKSGDMLTLTFVLERFLLDVNGRPHYIQILESVNSDDFPMAQCTLGQMYYGRHIAEIGRICTKGTKILRSKKLRAEIEKASEAGNVMAQYHMGIIGKENQEYSTALKWLSRAAIHYLPALHELGNLHDEYNAEVCYRQCAEFGYFLSQHALGLMAFRKKNFEEALYWLKKSTAQGYSESVEYLRRVVKSRHDQEFKEWAATAVFALEKILSDLNEQENQVEGKEITKKIDNLLQEEDIIQTLDNSSQKTPLVQQNVIQEEEEQKIDTDDSEKIKESSHNKQILSLTSFLYDNPQAVAEAQVSALMNFVRKNISTPKTQMGPQNHGKEMGVFNEELRSFLPMKKPSFAKAPIVSLTQAAFLDEKLVSQSEYFAQTGVAFATLRDAANGDVVRMVGGFNHDEGEDVLTSMLGWMEPSHIDLL